MPPILVTILSVNIVPGANYEAHWQGEMQEVTIDQDIQGTNIFLDNLSGVSHNDYYWLGHDWCQELNNTVLVEIVSRDGKLWLKKI